MDVNSLLSLLSVLAAFWALRVAQTAPIEAAKLSEKIKRQNDACAERQNQKQKIFSTLMQERAGFHTPEAVKAFNLIDVVFISCLPVRNAWADLIKSLDPDSLVSIEERDRRFRKLLLEIAKDLNLNDELKFEDIGRCYYPKSMFDNDRAKFLEAQATIEKFSGRESSSTNIASVPIVSAVFPPPPSRSKALSEGRPAQ